MKVVITSINLRSYWSFITLANYARKILKDLRRESACVAIKTRGLGKAHYTMTIWDDPEAMKRWYVQGQHLHAMKAAGTFAMQVSTLVLDGDTFLPWRSAKQLLKDKGRTITYN